MLSAVEGTMVTEVVDDVPQEPALHVDVAAAVIVTGPGGGIGGAV
jgi:hypothetical protein